MRYATPDEMFASVATLSPNEVLAAVLAPHVHGGRALVLSDDERSASRPSGVDLPDGLGFLVCMSRSSRSCPASAASPR